jgi:toxin HigB-1
MKITFADDKLQELCEQERIAQRKLGQACAHKLRVRLANLMAAEVVTDLVAGRPHHLKEDRLGQFALDLEGGGRLVFESANEPIPLDEDDAILLSERLRQRLVESYTNNDCFYSDYHD